MKREPLTDAGGGTPSPVVSTLLFYLYYVPRDEYRLWRDRRRTAR